MSANQLPLNLKEVAQRLGVHYMTAYRYVRQGQIEAHREGSEWRVEPAALESFRRRPAVATARSAAGGRVALLRDRLLAADQPGAWAVVADALASGVAPAACYLDLIGGAIAEVDERWQRGEVSLGDDHVASAIAHHLVARIGGRSQRPGRTVGDVVIGAPTGELHALPIAIVAGLLRLRRLDVLELGIGTPPPAFASAAARARRLRAVCIGLSTVAAHEAAAEACRLVHDAVPGARVIVGGQGVLNATVAAALGADAWAADGLGLIDLVTSRSALQG